VVETLEEDDPDMPGLVPQNSDEASTADYDDESDASSTSSEASDGASLSDEDLLDLLEPADVEPVPDTPLPQVQPLRRGTRNRRPNPKYVSMATTVSWKNLCKDEELQEACTVKAHTLPMPSLSTALSWETAPKNLRDILKMSDGPVKTAWPQSVRKEFKTLVDNNTFVKDTPKKGKQ
jgi:hypothetical protein